MNLWEIKQNNYNRKENKKKETIFTLANGYRGLRGFNEFSNYGWKGNFIAGIYDKSEAQIQEIVNNPDPLAIKFYINGEKINLDEGRIIKYERNLNMKKAVLNTNFELELESGKIVEVFSERFVSKNNLHRWGAKYQIKPKNFSGKLVIENIIDGTVTNSANDPYNEVRHYYVEKMKDLKPGISLRTVTKDKKISVVESTTIRCFRESENLLTNRKFVVLGEQVKELYELNIKENQVYTIYKYGVTFTSRDNISNLDEFTEKELNNFAFVGYEDELKKHIEQWDKIWENIDIEIKGDEKAQLGIRFNVFHLVSCANKDDPRVSIPAKGLHGEGYKGHIFWDTEIYMLPFFIYTQPETAKSLLLYRYNTSDGARKNAMLNGYKGTQFAWESTDDGLETTPKWGKDYLGDPVRIWTGDEEIHITADVAFAYWDYFRATNDEQFMIDYGAEIFFETAKFWESRVEYNYQKDRYEIKGVIGPDEFHEHVNNNAYTNYMAKWNLSKAFEISKLLKEKDPIKYERLCVDLGLSEKDFIRWNNISDKIYIPRYNGTKLIEQFEGYFNLKDYIITEWDKNRMPVWPKGVELDKLNKTQLVKQADVVMLLLLLEDEFDDETKKINYEYYEKRTMHKSSLSPSMYSIMGLKVGDTHNAYEYFIKTVMTDLEDNQGNSEYGLHAASTGGSWQCVVFGFGGLSVDEEGVLNFKPWLPEQWEELSFKVTWRGAKLKVDILRDKIIFLSDQNLKIKVFSEDCGLEQYKPFEYKF
ncbi:MAG TPA: glycosyl hydrolase family 65 protein [Defluviitoga sp.]|nr:glycosyl hydrolase family 65 protein [Defluviitoga sp.]HOP25267.1 glycosyl hydrolase family 65 protein [Defluviitoga sp.]HPZ29478.1 glycosyl hydrolase family 65 protein [Defluviitoga sp.]HQD63294.1 glycosyl hydrolase family 65 protein [Defluviitoga sp.]